MDSVESRARALCRAAGRNPDGYGDYADLRNGDENWKAYRDDARRSLEAQERATPDEPVARVHARRIMGLVRQDLLEAYIDRIAVEENGDTVRVERFVVPTQAEFAARVQAWRSVGLDISYENFDPATGSVDVWCKPGTYEQRIELRVVLKPGSATFEELLDGR